MHRPLTLIRHHGTACVELALCLPLIAGCFVAALDLSRVYRTQLALQDAVRCGTLLAASTPRSNANPRVWEDRIKNTVTQRLQSTLPGSAAAHQCLIDFTSVDQSAQIKVTGTVSFKLLVAWPFLPKQFDISDSLFTQRFR